MLDFLTGILVIATITTWTVKVRTIINFTLSADVVNC